MRAARALSAAFLALGFGVVTFIAVAVEPQMGFTDLPADFFDPELLAVANESTAWQWGNLIYLAIPVATWLLVADSEDAYLRWSGVVAGLLFFLVGAAGQVGFELPALLSGEDADAALVALMLVRFALLKTAVFAFGVFAWRMTRVRSGSGVVSAIWRAFGYVVLALGIAFIFVLVPVPIVFFLWGVGLTLKMVLGGQGAAAGTLPA